MLGPEDDAQHREVIAALRAWAREIDSAPYAAGLDIEALMARHYASLAGESEPVMTMVVTATAEATVVRVDGEIDPAGSRRLRLRLAEEIDLAPPALVLDLSRTEHCAARGLAMLLETTADAEAAGVPFAIAGCRPVVRRAVDALGLSEALPLHPSAAGALEWLGLVGRLRTLR